jgi:hypothetical protein
VDEAPYIGGGVVIFVAVLITLIVADSGIRNLFVPEASAIRALLSDIKGK